MVILLWCSGIAVAPHSLTSSLHPALVKLHTAEMLHVGNIIQSMTYLINFYIV